MRSIRLSHHNNEQAKMDRLVKIQTYHTELFAKFLTKLQNMPDGDGTMLDHSMILYGSNMSNSNVHNQYPLPTALVGGWKTVKGGQHLKYPEQTPLANMLLTVLDRAGVPLDQLRRQLGQVRGGLRCANFLWPQRFFWPCRASDCSVTRRRLGRRLAGGSGEGR